MKDALGRVDRVLVLGAGSDIASAAARRLARGGARAFVLAGRKPDRFDALARELRALGAERAVTRDFDALDTDAHEAFVDDIFDACGDVDLALLAFGVHGERDEAQLEHDGAIDVVATNYLGAVSVLLPIAGRMRAQGHGTIAVLSSVAGERGRKKNFVYGSSKAGLDAFCQGLGDRLAGTGVDVLVVRPGFVRTKMTAGVRPAPLATTPEQVAEAILDGIRARADTVWVPPAMRWIMSALRHLPRPVFRRLEI